MEEQDEVAAGRAWLARLDGVFAAGWRDALGRRWPELAGDVAALCEHARALGVLEGERSVAGAPGPDVQAPGR